ncbi:MAG TPA: hypothetical protein VKB86_21295 [Pyrinomonadaceae bacterium]|nr:hypothetical protein [Pyrinomonadaceae bacterium]
MRRFLRNLSIFLLAHLCLWAIVLWSYARQRPFGIEVAAATNEKQELLQKQASPRIILVGGSNLNFGIDSAEIERRTGYHPVNMGLNVGDGLAFMLKNVTPWLRSGDVVIVSPEYEHFGDFFNGKGDFLYSEVEHRPSMIRSFTFANYLEMLDKGYIIAGGILRYTINRRGDLMRRQLAVQDNPYRRDAFNQYGDLMGRTHEISWVRKTTDFVGPADVEVTPEKISRAITRLNQFDDECQKRGVRVFYSFPPVPQELFARHGQIIQEIAANVRSRIQFPVLDSPQEMTFPIENFFDGVYHLTAEGSEKRTDKLINELLTRGINITQGSDELHR